MIIKNYMNIEKCCVKEFVFYCLVKLDRGWRHLNNRLRRRHSSSLNLLYTKSPAEVTARDFLLDLSKCQMETRFWLLDKLVCDSIIIFPFVKGVL